MNDEVYQKLAGATGFDWDEGNAPKVRARHNVDPGECEQAFFAEPFVVLFDEKHSTTEPRWLALGKTLGGRKLFLIFTMRGTLIRVIGARDMSRKERHVYAQAEARVEKNPDV